MALTFLEAEWRKLVMANYLIDPSLLQQFVPAKTEIDFWNKRCYVSLVGFMFLNTRVLGFKIPLHRHFEEVNLRFYVRYKDQNEWKRGVVFIKEIVPKPAISLVANLLYQEHYETMPMEHQWEQKDKQITVEYRWKKGDWFGLKVIAKDEATPNSHGSEEEFITEHYWGYTKASQNRTSEYGVEHPSWDVYPTMSYQVDVDFERVYGSAFSFLSHEKPTSVFLAEGSAISVRNRRFI